MYSIYDKKIDNFKSLLVFLNPLLLRVVDNVTI